MKLQLHGIKRIFSVAMAAAVTVTSFSAPTTAFAELYNVVNKTDGTVYLTEASTADLAEWDGTVADEFAGGTGTENDPYQIANGEQLALLSQYVDSNNADYVFAYYTLTADILLNDDIDDNPTEWNSIGTRKYSGPDVNKDMFFRGTFDGNGHRIIGMYQSKDNEYGSFGLFANIDENATIKNLIVDGKIVVVKEDSGGICGFSQGIISNCINEVEIAIFTEDECGQIGGVCGQTASGIIENCCNKGKIYPLSVDANYYCVIGGVCGTNYCGIIRNCRNEADISGPGGVGGVCGTSYFVRDKSASVINCYNTGNITGHDMIGGVIGDNSTDLTECYNTGKISGDSYVGGLCGNHIFYSIEDCYNTGDITGSVAYVGGLFGEYNHYSNDVTEDIIRCYNTGNVRNTMTPNVAGYEVHGYTGGLCGYFSGCIISQCYNTGSVTSNESYYTGGLCGYAFNSLETGKISECFNSGKVTTSGNYVGGLASYINGCPIDNCYNTGAIKGNQYVGGLMGKSNSDTVTNCYNIGYVTATGTSARNPYFYPAGEDNGNITNVYYNNDVFEDLYGKNTGWGRSIAQLTSETAISDLGFDSEKWNKKANTTEYLYYPDLKNIAADNPAYSTSTLVPTGLTAATDYYSLTLSWDEFSGATEYAVFYSTDGTDFEPVYDTVTDTSYTLRDITGGTKYYFKVQAYVSDEWTCFSDTISVINDYFCLDGHSLDLDDEIGVKFIIDFPDHIRDNDTAIVKLTVNGRETSLPVGDASWYYYGYAFTCPVSAAEMNDTITGQVYIDGKAVGDSFTYSVKTYADYILANSEEYANEVPLVNAMLNYGAAAETYFRGSTALTFTNPDVDASQLSEYKYTLTDNDSAIDFVGQVISLKSKVTAKLYFKGGNLTISDFTVTKNGYVVDDEILFVGSDSYGTYLAISGISPDEMGQAFEIAVGGVTVSNYSVYSYVLEALSGSKKLSDVAAALYKYGCAAEMYG